MRTVCSAAVAAAAFVALTFAQPPGGGGGKGGGKGDSNRGQTSSVEAMVARMMAFDAYKDGKLTRDEITDERLMPLFERADANKDGVVTKEELTAMFEKEAAGNGNRDGGMGKGGPPGGGDGKGKGNGGPGGGMGGGPPQPGQIISSQVAETLNLTADQKAKIAALQKDVDAKLAAILTAEQRKQMTEGGRPLRPPQ